ncbi:hypothetical protein [Nocardia sp. NPDC050710]|uniref:hypothetical protein n=1 Tax=Nocardia sp. NPDC050710 TaxID=3157220 RepID=UPI0033CD63FF
MATAAAVLVMGLACGGEEDIPHSAPPHAADLTAVPAGVRWQVYQGVLVPGGEDGPATTGSAAATGFRQTPPGAALAAIVHTIRMSLAPDADWVDIARYELAFGPGKDEWVTSRGLLSIQSPADPAQAPRVRGYTITDYSPTRAGVDIYTSFPDQSIAVNTATVVWLAGDWWLQLPDPTSTDPVVRVAATMDAAVKLEASQ